MAERLIFKYDQTGNVEIDGQGFKGNACEKATAKFLQGRKKLSDAKKPEYYQSVGQGIQQK
jgi:hypothetical protein